MKLGPVTKLDKRNKKKKEREKFDKDLMSEDCDLLTFFQFTGNSEQSGSQTPDA